MAHTLSETERLAVSDTYNKWKKWGPYLAERQWGTVREDYSQNGDAWNFVNHDQARSNAYRWGEEGIGGFCDSREILCLAPAFWNGKDPIIKERLFGLTNNQGNHGEDVKELYFHQVSTPTHSYNKYLYKYPHNEFPYEEIIQNNKRSRVDTEFELLDTDTFKDNDYFDCFLSTFVLVVFEVVVTSLILMTLLSPLTSSVDEDDDSCFCCCSRCCSFSCLRCLGPNTLCDRWKS